MRRSVLSVSLCSVAGLATPLFAQTAEPTTTKETSVVRTTEREIKPEREARPRASTNAAITLLKKRVESIDWLDKPFEDIVKWLSDQGESQVNVIMREGPLGVESVSRDTAVNLRLINTTVGDVLNETMRALSEDGEVTYHAHGNTLTISTKQDFGREMYVRVYDVTDLLMRVPDFGQSAPQIDLQTVAQNSGGQGGGGGQSVFGGAGGGEEEDDEGGQQGEMETLRRLGEVRNTILRTIHPDSWEDTPQAIGGGGAGLNYGTGGAPVGGGGKGRIHVYNRALIVYNTIEVHEAIVGEFRYDE